MRTVAIIQARMGSTRLPGKVLKNLLGKPMLVHIFNRVNQSKLVDQVVIATSINKENNVIRAVCKENNISYFSGSENNVLERFFYTACHFEAEQIIRITADCPLIDSDIINKLIERFNNSNYNFMGVAAGAGASNSDFKGNRYPQGLDAEIFMFDILKKAYKEATSDRDKEHVTPYIWTKPSVFKIGQLKAEKDYSEMRWVIDNPEDFDFIEQIYKKLYPKNPNFGMKEILNFLESNKTLQNTNKKFIGKEGHEQFWKKE